MNSESSPLFAHIPLFLANIYFEFQVYMFSNGRDMTNCHSFCTMMMTIAISPVFSENSRAKYCGKEENAGNQTNLMIRVPFRLVHCKLPQHREVKDFVIW